MEGIPDDFLASLRNRPGIVVEFWARKELNAGASGKVCVGKVVSLGSVDVGLDFDILV